MMTTRVKTAEKINDVMNVNVEFDDGAGSVTTKLYTLSLSDDVTTEIFRQRVAADAAEIERQNALAAEFQALIGQQLL